jgi:hypothetical protein
MTLTLLKPHWRRHHQSASDCSESYSHILEYYEVIILCASSASFGVGSGSHPAQVGRFHMTAI